LSGISRPGRLPGYHRRVRPGGEGLAWAAQASSNPANKEREERAMRLEGRRILLTGAASGIGRASAEACRREGARLTLLDVDPQVADLAQSLGATPLAVDLRNLAALPGAVD